PSRWKLNVAPISAAASSSTKLTVRTLTDGGQQPLEIAHAIADWLGEARTSLELAQYDFHLAPETAAVVAGAIHEASARGVAVRIIYNVDHRNPIPVPPPPEPDVQLIESLGVPSKAVGADRPPDRARETAGADLLARDHRGARARNTGAARLRGRARRRGLPGCPADRGRGLPVARKRQRRLEAAPTRAGGRRRLHRQAVDAVRDRNGARLHAREDRRRRRCRVLGLIQPLALRRAERGERPRDPRSGARGTPELLRGRGAPALPADSADGLERRRRGCAAHTGRCFFTFRHNVFPEPVQVVLGVRNLGRQQEECD